jgi:hypothetical protein
LGACNKHGLQTFNVVLLHINACSYNSPNTQLGCQLVAKLHPVMGLISPLLTWWLKTRREGDVHWKMQGNAGSVQKGTAHSNSNSKSECLKAFLTPKATV